MKTISELMDERKHITLLIDQATEDRNAERLYSLERTAMNATIINLRLQLAGIQREIIDVMAYSSLKPNAATKAKSRLIPPSGSSPRSPRRF